MRRKKTKLSPGLEHFYEVVGAEAEKISRDDLSLHAHMKSNAAMRATHTALVDVRKVFHAMARDSHREAEFYHRKAASEFPARRAHHIQCAGSHQQMLDYHHSALGLGPLDFL